MATVMVADFTLDDPVGRWAMPARQRLLRCAARLAPLLILAFGACTSTRYLPLPETPAAAARVVEDEGASETLVIHVRRYATSSDSTVRAPFEDLEFKEQLRHSDQIVVVDPGRALREFALSSAVPWSDVLAISRVRRDRPLGIVEGFAIGAGAGAAIGALIGALSFDPCPECDAFAFNSRGGAASFGGMIGAVALSQFGALFGLLSGARRRTVWRR